MFGQVHLPPAARKKGRPPCLEIAMASRRAHVKEISFKTLVNMLEQDGEEAFPIIQFNGTNHYMAYVQAGAGPGRLPATYPSWGLSASDIGITRSGEATKGEPLLLEGQPLARRARQGSEQGGLAGQRWAGSRH